MKGQSRSWSSAVMNGRRSLVLNTQWEYEQTYDMLWIQPSLRDFGDRESEPGSELPGYCRFSLREIKDTHDGSPKADWSHDRSCPQDLPPPKRFLNPPRPKFRILIHQP